MPSKKKKSKTVITFTDLLVKKLKKSPIEFDHFLGLLENNDQSFFNNPELEMELLLSNGFPLDINNNSVVLSTNETRVNDQCFCVLDIETNGNSVQSGQIIEVGAIRYQNGKMIEHYESLVYAKEIPSYIQDVTNITPAMLEQAPPLKEVLKTLKLFIGSDVVVAHNSDFDYTFISESFKQANLGELFNRSLCTIKLAKQVMQVQRYGLGFLKEVLNIPISNHHRAYSDALSTTLIFQHCLSLLPNQSTLTVEELIDLSSH